VTDSRREAWRRGSDRIADQRHDGVDVGKRSATTPGPREPAAWPGKRSITSRLRLDGGASVDVFIRDAQQALLRLRAAVLSSSDAPRGVHFVAPLRDSQCRPRGNRNRFPDAVGRCRLAPSRGPLRRFTMRLGLEFRRRKARRRIAKNATIHAARANRRAENIRSNNCASPSTQGLV